MCRDRWKAAFDSIFECRTEADGCAEPLTPFTQAREARLKTSEEKYRGAQIAGASREASFFTRSVMGTFGNQNPHIGIYACMRDSTEGAMPRYYFNVSDGSYIADSAGVELASEQDARNEALRLARRVPGHAKVIVTDTSGKVICEAHVWAPQS